MNYCVNSSAIELLAGTLIVEDSTIGEQATNYFVDSLATIPSAKAPMVRT